VNNEKNSDGLIGTAVRRVLMSSAALAPLYLMSQGALAQSVPTGPTANAGPDQTIADSDGLPGEPVALDGSASVPLNTGDVLTYVWTNAQGTQIASGATATIRLPDGVNQITLAVSEDDGSSSESQGTLTAIDTVTVTVGASSSPVANAGPARSVADTDGQPGEIVSLDGSGSTDTDGTIVSYEWFRDNTPLGTGTTPVLNNVALPDGANNIRLVVRDNAGNTGTITTVITVGAAAPPATPGLATLNLKPNEMQVAKNLDDLCARIA
jgi:hypothetical protein